MSHLRRRSRPPRAIIRRILRSRNFARYSLWGVPLYPGEVRGSEALRTFWEGARPITRVPASPEARMDPAVVSVEGPVEIPSPAPTLLLFAGKGGVGKTTLACATSLGFGPGKSPGGSAFGSTDPAHSLSTCLELPVGPAPRRICPGLTALEVDAEAEFKPSSNSTHRSCTRSFNPSVRTRT